MYCLCLQERTINFQLCFSRTKHGTQYLVDIQSLSLHSTAEDTGHDCVILTRKSGCLALPQTTCMIPEHNQLLVSERIPLLKLTVGEEMLFGVTLGNLLQMNYIIYSVLFIGGKIKYKALGRS